MRGKGLGLYLELITLPWAGLQKMSIDSLECSSPRKSLVKGERFMRGIEEKPEWCSAWQSCQESARFFIVRLVLDNGMPSSSWICRQRHSDAGCKPLITGTCHYCQKCYDVATLNCKWSKQDVDKTDIMIVTVSGIASCAACVHVRKSWELRILQVKSWNYPKIDAGLS